MVTFWWRYLDTPQTYRGTNRWPKETGPNSVWRYYCPLLWKFCCPLMDAVAGVVK